MIKMAESMAFGGRLTTYKHISEMTKSPMYLNVFKPKRLQTEGSLYFLPSFTNDHDTVPKRSGCL